MKREQEMVTVSSIRVSPRLRLRLAKIKARLLLKNGKEKSMEELIDLMADIFEKHENEVKD